MEASLFWIAIGLLIYGLLLRQFFKSPRLTARRGLIVGLHLFFRAGVGALIGFVFSASTELQGPTPRWPIVCAVLGVLFGLYEWGQADEAAGPMELVSSDAEWVETSYSAILLASVIMYAVLQAFKIPSGSMEDTLQIGDHLFVNKFIYGVRIPFSDRRILKWHDVRHGDVVVFEAPQSAILSPEERDHHVRKDFIKRAIGLPGDVIQIKNKHVFVNNVLQVEPYTVFRDPNAYPAERLNITAENYQRVWTSGRFDQLRREEIGDNFGPVTVPPGHYFCMGDNRDGSFDSRFWGPLPNRLLKGEAWVVYWPLNRVKVIR